MGTIIYCVWVYNYVFLFLFERRVAGHHRAGSLRAREVPLELLFVLYISQQSARLLGLFTSLLISGTNPNWMDNLEHAYYTGWTVFRWCRHSLESHSTPDRQIAAYCSAEVNDVYLRMLRFVYQTLDWVINPPWHWLYVSISYSTNQGCIKWFVIITPAAQEASLDAFVSLSWLSLYRGGLWFFFLS